jgi:NAD(P)-dependent dehydrogenase (short-subunit alcohol dehydrogenase family)
MSIQAHPVVLVTGAGSGLGLATALQLAAAGYQVYGAALTIEEEEALAAASRHRGLTVHTLRMDVTHRDEVEAAAGTIRAAAGRLDALVQFAGVGLRGFFEDLTLDEIQRVYAVNVFGTMTVTQVMLPLLRASRGRIVITSSIGGRIGSMSISGYASSKFAVEGFAECLAQEVAPFGVRVSLLEPGLVLTEHFTVHRNRARRATDPSSPYYLWFCRHEQMVDTLLRRNRFTPGDIARLVERILASRRPRLRYVVGAKARLVVSLRRHIPGEWFERVYFGIVRRLVTAPGRPAPALSDLGAPAAEVQHKFVGSFDEVR